MTDTAIDQALRADQPGARLRQLAADQLSQGATPEEILSHFEQVRTGLRAAGRDADEDVVLDVMDFLTGWCSPHMKLIAPAGRVSDRNGTQATTQSAPRTAGG